MSELIQRTFAASLTPGDGRTVDCRIVPYGERIQHDDGLGGVAKGVPYSEEWAVGAFAHQERAANRVVANVEHQAGLQGIVGHGVAFREDTDGFYGSFRLHDNPDGDKALMLVNEGVLDGVSLEARPVKSVRTRDGVVQRVKANLEAIAFTRFSAYAGAQVLAVREHDDQPHQVDHEELPDNVLPFEMSKETVERCRNLGIVLPERYETHPDDEDTTAQAATS